MRNILLKAFYLLKTDLYLLFLAFRASFKENVSFMPLFVLIKDLLIHLEIK